MRRFIYPILLLLVISAGVWVRHMIMLGFRTNFDSGIFISMAWWMGKGAVPYRDLVENKPPGIELFALGAIKCVGLNVTRIRFLYHASVTAAALPAFMIAKRIHGSRAGLWAALLFTFCPLALNERCIDVTQLPLMTTFTALAVWLYIEGVTRKNTWYSFSAGVSLGLAGLIKQPAIMTLLAILGFEALVLCFRKDLWRECGGFRRSLAVVVGSGLVMLGLSSYLLANGALDDFWTWTFRANEPSDFALSPEKVSFEFDRFRAHFPFLLGGIGVLLYVIRLVRTGVRACSWKDLLPILLILWFLADWGFTFLTPYFLHHYFYPLLIPASIFGGLAIERVIDWGQDAPDDQRTFRILLPRTFLALFCILYIGYHCRGHIRDVRFSLHPDLNRPGLFQESVVAREIVRRTAPEDSIQVFGNSIYYSLADRIPACRFFYYADVIAGSQLGEAYVETFVETIHSRKPALVILSPNTLAGPGARPIVQEIERQYRLDGVLPYVYHGEVQFWVRS